VAHREPSLVTRGERGGGGEGGGGGVRGGGRGVARQIYWQLRGEKNGRFRDSPENPAGMRLWNRKANLRSSALVSTISKEAILATFWTFREKGRRSSTSVLKMCERRKSRL